MIITLDKENINCPICGQCLIEDASFDHEFGTQEEFSDRPCECCDKHDQVYNTSIEFVEKIGNIEVWQSDIDEVFYLKFNNIVKAFYFTEQIAMLKFMNEAK